MDRTPIAFGKFLLTERLGRGGMAEVWKARITGPMGYARKVVVKRILPSLAEEPRFVDMFIAEARLSACLSHTNIVQVYEFGSIDGEFYLAMEYVPGRDLAATMRAIRPLALPPVGLGALVGREVCRALGYAHSLVTDDGAPLRLIHRDVTPSNVMLGFDGSVKLLDFGIAKALAEVDAEGTRADVLKGKLAYVAPERLDELEPDGRVDQFSAGVVLWELLSGRRLFKGRSEAQTIDLVRAAEVLPPSVYNHDVPPELDRVCLKMLERDRDRRYESCAEAAAELDEIVHKLRWGQERLAGLMRQAFPDGGEITDSLPKIDPLPSSRLTVSGLRRRRRERWILAATLSLLTLTSVTWVLARHGAAPATAAKCEPPSLEVTRR